MERKYADILDETRRCCEYTYQLVRQFCCFLGINHRTGLLLCARVKDYYKILQFIITDFTAL